MRTQSPQSSAPPPPLAVAHVTLSFERGGRRDAIVTLARELAPLGVTSHLVTLRGDPAEATPFLDAFGSHLHLESHGLPSPRTVLTLRRWCRERGVEVVHTHDASSQFVASALHTVAWNLHPLMTFHRSLGFESARRRDRLRNAASLLLVDRVLTASEERRRHFLAENMISARKVSVIPLGIDLERFRSDPTTRGSARAEVGVADDELLVVTVGHLGEEKGVDLAIRAAAVARAAGARFRLVHLGTGSPERQAVIHSLGGELLGDQVQFLGQRSDPERWFRAADLLLHAPRVEAFGLVLVQAMASGTPVVAAAVGGIPEVVTDGVTGLLAPPEDAEALGAALAGLLADPGRRAAMGAAARGDAEARFAASRFAADHRRLYESLRHGGP